jgi:pimeloyl-ACP methyl ester carboxylesterase
MTPAATAESGGTTELTDYCWDSLGATCSAYSRLGIESACFSGSSMGGGTILYLAIRRPEVVRKIVLLSPPPVGQQQSAPGAALLGGFAMLVEGLGLKEAVNIVLRMKPWADMKKSAPMIHQLIKHWMLSLNAEAIVPAIRASSTGRRFPTRPDAGGRPTLLVRTPERRDASRRLGGVPHCQIPNSRPSWRLTRSLQHASR